MMSKRAFIVPFLAILFASCFALDYSVEVIPLVENASYTTLAMMPNEHMFTYDEDFGTWTTKLREYDSNRALVNQTVLNDVVLSLWTFQDLIFESWYSNGTLRIFNTTSNLRTVIPINQYVFPEEYYNLETETGLHFRLDKIMLYYLM